ncbi:MAG: protein translocase subunit SecD [Chloroflexi bacterium]|nr:protein translocase subunit SecD [Chloroflexota bacterium]HCU80235.1 protein translocase subunit SecD [Chloroflexota bacterium]
MINRRTRMLIFLFLLLSVSLWIASPYSELNIKVFGRNIDWSVEVRQGLDLQGGLQVLLEADTTENEEISMDAMAATRSIVEQRVNGLGVTEPVVQSQGTNRISVELPGIDNPEEAVALLKETGLLEFVDLGNNPLPPGTSVLTDKNTGEMANVNVLAERADAGEEIELGDVIFETIMTGADLRSANVGRDQVTSAFQINFTLTEDGTDVFGEHTANHIGSHMAIVLDGKVISSPVIRDAIPSGNGVISGDFDSESANKLALQLRYGSLPVPLSVVNSRTIGPTLGQDSVRLSMLAGLIGFTTVALFMVLYYRLPGVVAVLALAMYAAITFSLFKLIPVTLTLPGIAGFVLSVGVAVDANILIFERMKEELRDGRGIEFALKSGFLRAWPSIRDSNISTIITCTILFWFGSTFGASIVKGFALTLAIGVGVSMFTAIVATRNLLYVFLGRLDLDKRKKLLGV